MTDSRRHKRGRTEECIYQLKPNCFIQKILVEVKLVKSETFVYFANTEIPWNISQLAMDVATVRLEDQFVDSEIQHIIPILHNEALSRFSDVES